MILSNNASNRALNRVQFVPLASSPGRLYPSEAIVRTGKTGSQAMDDQIATADKRRLKSRLGRIPAEDLMEIERVVKTQFGLEDWIGTGKLR